MTESTIDKVKEFNKAFDIKSGDESSPKVDISNEIRSMLADMALMYERHSEMLEGLAEQSDGDPIVVRVQMIMEELSEVVKAIVMKDTTNLLHELADLRYVCDGAAVQFGLGDKLENAVAEIHRANMSKLAPDGKPIFAASGRVMKSSLFVAADVKFLLKKAH